MNEKPILKLSDGGQKNSGGKTFLLLLLIAAFAYTLMTQIESGNIWLILGVLLGGLLLILGLNSIPKSIDTISFFADKINRCQGKSTTTLFYDKIENLTVKISGYESGNYGATFSAAASIGNEYHNGLENWISIHDKEGNSYKYSFYLGSKSRMTHVQEKLKSIKRKHYKGLIIK